MKARDFAIQVIVGVSSGLLALLIYNALTAGPGARAPLPKASAPGLDTV